MEPPNAISRENRLARLRDLLREVERLRDPAAASLAVRIRRRISAIEVADDDDEGLPQDWVTQLIAQVAFYG
jgi:hypothetical protein